MKSADPYPVIPAGIAGIQVPGMAKAVGVESLVVLNMQWSCDDPIEEEKGSPESSSLPNR